MEPIQLASQPVVQSTGSTFADTGLCAPILEALNTLQLTIPTAIQAQAIPIARKGQDVMGIAQTGTGKTFAFALPILEKLLANPGKALIVVPTRELALQVEESIKRVTRLLSPGIRSVTLIGGEPIYRQKADLRNNPRIIVCTPGRLRDHLQQRTVFLEDVTTVVLDEADRMLDMGFAPQIKLIMETVPGNRQTMCFSATMAPEISRLANAYMNNPVRVEVATAGQSNLKIDQEMCYVHPDDKTTLLNTLIKDHPGRILVFSRTKHGAKKLNEKLRVSGHASAEIHSNRSLSQRRHALEGFKSGQYRVLVATDVAARGIDVQNITLVVNYDLPDAAEDYVHRIGRTGRAGLAGKAISMATVSQARDVKSIERLIQKNIAISPYSKETVAQPVYGDRQNSDRRYSAWQPAGQRRSGGSGSGGGGYGNSRPRFSSSRRSR